MGLFQSAQALLASVLGLARTRLELLGTELQETLARLVLLVICAVTAGLALVFPDAAALPPREPRD